MIFFNDRRKSPTFKNPAVGAAAKAGAIKYAPKEEMVPMNKVSKIGTRIFGDKTYTTTKPKMVAKGSKKEARYKAREAWADAHEAKVDAKYAQKNRIESKKAELKAKKRDMKFAEMSKKAGK